MKSLVAVSLLILSTKMIMLGKPDSLYAVVHGDSVTIWDVGFTSNCASKYKTVTASFPDFEIWEVDTMSFPAYCDCTFDMSILLTGLQPGTDTVTICRIYYESDIVWPMGTVSFTIGPSAESVLTISSHQSDCLTSAVDMQNEPLLPERFALYPSYPNPFNPAATIRYDLPKACHVSLSVYNLVGEVVAKLVDGFEQPGNKSVVWDAANFSSGVYFCRLSAGGFTQTRKMVLMK